MAILSKNVLRLMVAAVLPVCAFGQDGLRDPMMPPPQAWAASSVAGASGLTPQESASGRPTVQVLLIGASRQYAVIDGQMLKPGSRLDAWRLDSISSRGVVLRDVEGTQAVSAFPAVKKNMRPGSTGPAGSNNANP